jgi:hypothetical protein
LIIKVGKQENAIKLLVMNSRDELTSREGEIIRQYKSECECVNIRIAGRTKKEYYEENKDKIQYYYEKNETRSRRTG